MNLSETISKEIKNKLPMYIKINSQEKEITNFKLEINKSIFTEKQKEKQKLILQIKKEASNGKSYRSIAREYKIDRKTVSKYVNTNNIEEASIYDTSNRNYSYLDKYKDEVMKLYKQTRNVAEVYRILKKKEIELTYSNLSQYISKIIKNNILEDNNKSKTQKIKKISRGQVIKYIFNWKYNEETKENIKNILEKYPELKTYKYFYQRFKNYLTNLNTLCFINLVSSHYQEKCINKFIASLKTDWEAVINAASYHINNGVTEGNVNKIKQIKRDMYGRASYELLRKKVIYQSLFS